MSKCAGRKVASDVSKFIICDLPIDILHKILELMPIIYAARASILSKQWRKLWSTLPHLVFDPLFFQYLSNMGTSAASVIHKILMQHTGNILGFHLISETHRLSQSDMDQCIIFLSNHGVQNLTLDMASDQKYVLPDNIFTCATLTNLKLTTCMFGLPGFSQFPNLVSLQLEHSEIVSSDGSKTTILILPMLKSLVLKFCVDVDSVDMVSPKLVNLSIISSYTVTFECFNVNPIFKRLKHLCLDGSSLKNLGSVPVPDMLEVSLNLQSLRICDLKISVKRITCALRILRNSPNLIELEIDGVVKVNETIRHTEELYGFLAKAEKEVSGALRMIRTVRLRKFKGTPTEMYLMEVMLARSPKLERMIIERCKQSNATHDNQHLKELVSYPRASPNAEIKYT